MFSFVRQVFQIFDLFLVLRDGVKNKTPTFYGYVRERLDPALVPGFWFYGHLRKGRCFFFLGGGQEKVGGLKSCLFISRSEKKENVFLWVKVYNKLIFLLLGRSSNLGGRGGQIDPSPTVFFFISWLFLNHSSINLCKIPEFKATA